jgi:conjugative transfer signal peptidase TraF
MRGICPGDSLPLMKRVIALSGDVVAVEADGVRVNGKLIVGSAPLSLDSAGHVIPGHVPRVPTVVAPGRMWVLGDWFKSWDSRYFGDVSESRVIGNGFPLITLPAGS